jgi:hypothetical protein
VVAKAHKYFQANPQPLCGRKEELEDEAPESSKEAVYARVGLKDGSKKGDRLEMV